MTDSPYKNYNELLLRILEAIDYEDDKNAFIKKFANLLYMQSLKNLIQSSSSAEQEKIKQELSTMSDGPERIEEIIEKYFNGGQRSKALELAIKNGMTDYFKTIDKTLSPSQKQRISELLVLRPSLFNTKFPRTRR